MADQDSRAGMRYGEPAVLDYVARLHAAHDAPLQRAFDAPAANDMPSIQIGPSEGRLLHLLLKLVGARRVLEIGTLAGYSAIWMARALPADGRLWTIEVEPKHVEIARANFEAAGVADRIEIVSGAADTLLDEVAVHAPFDAVFIDADKERYDVYGRWAAAHIRPGGLLLVDNAYVFGKLLADDERGAAGRRLHEEARAHFDTVCAPTPDGMLIGIRRPDPA